MKQMHTVKNISPGKLSLIPLFYIGWSDSVLSPSEMEFIHEKLQTMDFLTDDDKDYLIRWTDPKNPPREEVFREWTRIIREHRSMLSKETVDSLADLGLELAQSSTQYRSEEIWGAPKTKAALRDIETNLGVDNQHSLNLLLGQVQDSEQNTSASKPSFDTHKMLSFLDGNQKTVRERMRKLLRDPFFAYKHFPNKDDFREHTLKLVKALAGQGVGAYAFPKKYGGGELPGGHIAVFEMLALSDLSLTIKFGVQFGLFGGAVYGLGTEQHHEKYISDMCQGKLLGCFAMTETGHGSNVKGLETTAIYNWADQSITINSPNEAAGKEYIGNALHAEMAAVFAQLIVGDVNHGVHCVLVPLRDKEGNTLPGIRVEDCGYKMGLNGVDNGRIWFDQVKVPKENLLNKHGDITSEGNYVSNINSINRRFFTMLGALVAGRVCVGLAGNNVSKSALTIAIKYALKRRQFAGKSEEEMLLMDYPTHQRRLIPKLAKTYALHFALSELAEQYVAIENEEDRRKIETDAAGLKAVATWHCTETVQECREACGGKGYLSENRFADLKADTDVFTTFEGDNTVLMQLVAKGILTEFKQSFHNDGVRAVVRYLGTRFSNTLTEYNPYQRRNTNWNHLNDHEFLSDAFKYRKDKILLSLSNRMQDYLKKRIHPHDAFLKCQVHMVSLAQAYIDEKILLTFQQKVRECEEGKEKKMLDKLCRLYALRTIEQEKAWFLENDFMEGSKSKAIRRVVTKLCQELRPELSGLVDSFGIPQELLGAKIIM